MMEKYMKIAINEAKKAAKHGEIPVGAVIVKDGKIIAKAHNKIETRKLSTCHAEILAIHSASKKLHNWRLNDCEIYVTMEPCMMCCGAIIQSRISKVIFGTANENFGYSSILHKYDVQVINDICKDQCKKMVQEFFVKKRNQNL